MAIFKLFSWKNNNDNKGNANGHEMPQTGTLVFGNKLSSLTRTNPLFDAQVSPGRPEISLESGFISLSEPGQKLSFRSTSPQRDTTRTVHESVPLCGTVKSLYPSEESIKLYEKAKRRGSCDLYQLKKVHRTKIFPRRALLRRLEHLHLRSPSSPPTNMPAFRLRAKTETEPMNKVEPIRWPLLDAASDSYSDSHYSEESNDDEEDPEAYQLHLPTKLPRYQHVKSGSRKLATLDRCHRAQTASLFESSDDEKFFRSNLDLRRATH